MGKTQYFWGSSTERKTYSVKIVVPLVGTMEGTAIVRQDGTVKINDETYYKSVTTFDGIPGSGAPGVSYARLGEDGVYSRNSTDPSAQETLEIPLPAEVGRKWKSSQGELQLDMEIAAIEDFDTVEKTYRRCLKVIGKGRQGASSIETVMYYAPKVGFVRMSTSGAVMMEMKLNDIN